jgi:hypothetical protein
MSLLAKVYTDMGVMQYMKETFSHTYYTCIPREDRAEYECVNIMFDDCYSPYDTSKWRELGVHKIVPRAYHANYLRRLNNGVPTVIVD